ncbi:MAG TPA: hypothetical protein PKA00_03830 [Saprospiraceae bacterium]|nr:hypothetical protein [Saprospiraceae bacterium]HMQ82007.1 hypothetical protein [Saprospiraceae bacterium]
MIRTKLFVRHYWIGIWCCLLGLASCQFGEKDKPGEDTLLAKVHNKALYLSELDEMIPEGIAEKDSLEFIENYVNRWIREALLLDEAERNAPKDLNIDKLVRDYRASLLKYSYEQTLMEELLDSTISQQELVDFYERNKEQYQLETPIMRCFFIKIPSSTDIPNDFERWWDSEKSGDREKLVEYCGQFAEAYLLNENDWYKVEEVASAMPPGTVTPDNVSAKREFSQKDESHRYFLRVFEVKKRKDIAPLAYIQEQARKVILRSKKDSLMEKTIDAMYQRELRRNNIQTYID